MAHAGIPHIWSLPQAMALAAEVEAVVQGSDYKAYFRAMYGNRPDRWEDDLKGMSRWRAITNYFTRMRFVYADGRMDFAHKGALADAPAELLPWFELRARRPLRSKLLFGHWAALEGHSGQPDIIGLDTGCVWGRALTALNLNTAEVTQVVSLLVFTCRV